MDLVIMIVVSVFIIAVIWILVVKAKSTEYVDNFEKVRRSAQHGDVYAQYTLARMYADGKGVEQDKAEAARWYRETAGQDHIEAQFILGTLYEHGDGVPQDDKEAFQWYSSAARAGHDKAQNTLTKDKWRALAARLEHRHHTEETPIPEEEPQETVDRQIIDNYLAKAQEGDLDAQYNLGIIYYNGQGVPKDYKEALNWFLQASQQGDADAQYNLGIMYGRGEGVAKNREESIKWLQMAAEQNHGEARNILKRLYEKG